jgi:type III pantothenate kinase
MSVLCIDCGNTRLKWGLRENGRWSAQDALPIAQAAKLGGMLPQAPSRMIACNVAGEAAGAAIEALAAGLGVSLQWLRSQQQECGVTNGYDDPARLGVDRWAALIGARGLHVGACLVVNAGTATTVDVLDAEGMFQGGLILPGLAMMREALARNTAGLPLAAGSLRDLPRNTDDAIASGCLNATLGAIERMFGRIADAPQPLCLLSGGASESLRGALAIPCREVPNLVLEGLGHIAESELR